MCLSKQDAFEAFWIYHPILVGDCVLLIQIGTKFIHHGKLGIKSRLTIVCFKISSSVFFYFPYSDKVILSGVFLFLWQILSGNKLGSDQTVQGEIFR